MLLFMSFMYSRKRTGPRTEPCHGRPGGGGARGAVAPPLKYQKCKTITWKIQNE